VITGKTTTMEFACGITAYRRVINRTNSLTSELSHLEGLPRLPDETENGTTKKHREQVRSIDPLPVRTFMQAIAVRDRDATPQPTVKAPAGPDNAGAAGDQHAPATTLMPITASQPPTETLTPLLRQPLPRVQHKTFTSTRRHTCQHIPPRRELG
jgi:hypothetical protein